MIKTLSSRGAMIPTGTRMPPGSHRSEGYVPGEPRRWGPFVLASFPSGKHRGVSMRAVLSFVILSKGIYICTKLIH